MSDTRDEQPAVGLPKLSEALCWLHVRTRALEEVRRVAPESDASRIAGQALCMGPNGGVLCELANWAAAADKGDAPTAAKTAFASSAWLEELEAARRREERALAKAVRAGETQQVRQHSDYLNALEWVIETERGHSSNAQAHLRAGESARDEGQTR